SLKTKRIEKQRFFLEQLFSSEAVHPIVKTVALKTVMEEEVDIDFMITKFGETKKVNALQLQRTTPYFFAEQVEA
ncbi:tetratricopeptide repeat protein, partial [Bacillus cereus]|nr:tetratricopeptide repeat protein [Bacillus cereus]